MRLGQLICTPILLCKRLRVRLVNICKYGHLVCKNHHKMVTTALQVLDFFDAKGASYIDRLTEMLLPCEL